MQVEVAEYYLSKSRANKENYSKAMELLEEVFSDRKGLYSEEIAAELKVIEI